MVNKLKIKKKSSTTVIIEFTLNQANELLKNGILFSNEFVLLSKERYESLFLTK